MYLPAIMKLMPNTVNYFLVAENVIRGEDGGLTIVKVFNKLLAEKVPIVNPKITLVFGFFPPKNSQKDGTVKIKLQILDPNDKEIAELKANAKRIKPKSKDGLELELTSFVDLSSDLVLPDFGIYKFRLWCDSKLLAENRFEVASK